MSDDAEYYAYRANHNSSRSGIINSALLTHLTHFVTKPDGSTKIVCSRHACPICETIAESNRTFKGRMRILARKVWRFVQRLF